jgi:5-methylcytosine-specific restriction endonuclease McrA
MPHEPRGLSQPSLEEMVRAMEERWEAFRLTKLRTRGTIAVGLRFDVFIRDQFRCRYCGVSVDDGAILHADHVIPESKGGPTTMENLVTACIDCNLGKSDKDLPA